MNCQLIRPLVINSAFKLDPFFTYNTSNIGAQGMFYLTFSSVQFSLVGFYNATQWIVLNRMEWYGIWFYRIETNTRLNSVEWKNILMYVRICIYWYVYLVYARGKLYIIEHQHLASQKRTYTIPFTINFSILNEKHFTVYSTA